MRLTGKVFKVSITSMLRDLKKNMTRIRGGGGGELRHKTMQNFQKCTYIICTKNITDCN